MRMKQKQTFGVGLTPKKVNNTVKHKKSLLLTNGLELKKYIVAQETAANQFDKGFQKEDLE
jgi:hypothetical protein